MTCPKCFQEMHVIPIGETHYLCKKEEESEETGCGTQFEFVEDSILKFPFSVIFSSRSKREFFRKPYLNIASADTFNLL